MHWGKWSSNVGRDSGARSTCPSSKQIPIKKANDQLKKVFPWSLLLWWLWEILSLKQFVDGSFHLHRQVTVKGRVKWQNPIFPGGMIKVLSNLIIWEICSNRGNKDNNLSLSLFRCDLKMRWHELTTSSHSLISFLFVSVNMRFHWWDLTPPLEQRRTCKNDKGKRLQKERTISHLLQIALWSRKMSLDNVNLIRLQNIWREAHCVLCDNIYSIKNSPLLQAAVFYLSAQGVLSHVDLCIYCMSKTQVLTWERLMGRLFFLWLKCMSLWPTRSRGVNLCSLLILILLCGNIRKWMWNTQRNRLS